MNQGNGRKRLLEVLLYAGQSLSVEQISRALGISRNATYQHITALERDGLVEKAQLSQTKGRPGQTYLLSRAGRSTFTQHYGLIAELLVGLIKSRQGSDELDACFKELGDGLAERFKDRVSGLGPKDRVREVAMIMQELGYESRSEETPDGPQIAAHNCVFHDLAEKHREVCSLDLSLMSKLTGTKIEHLECMVRGGTCCRFKPK